MPAKASSDFGLYKEKQKENHLKSIKFVLVIVVTVLLFVMLLYTVIHFMNHNDSHYDHVFEDTLEKPAPTAERLVSSESIKRETFQSAPPKPFGVTHRGLPPSQFTSSSTTEKITTLNYPQLNNYRHKNYPKNIQDVIGHANRNKMPIEIKYNKHYRQASTQQSAKNFSYSDNDPFYLFKPQDPGDINLLATASVRFAPPLWSNPKKTFSKGPPLLQQYLKNINRQENYNQGKPLSLTLNIYPNNENTVHTDYRYGLRHFANHRFENLQSRIRLPDNKPKKMVVHLNLYPDIVNDLNNPSNT